MHGLRVQKELFTLLFGVEKGWASKGEWEPLLAHKQRQLLQPCMEKQGSNSRRVLSDSYVLIDFFADRLACFTECIKQSADAHPARVNNDVHARFGLQDQIIVVIINDRALLDANSPPQSQKADGASHNVSNNHSLTIEKLFDVFVDRNALLHRSGVHDSVSAVVGTHFDDRIAQRKHLINPCVLCCRLFVQHLRF